MRAGSLGLALTLTAAPVSAQRPADAVARAVRPAVEEAHVEFLASDALEGRGTGTRGGALAAKYVAAQFERLGLEPAGDSGSYFQRLPLAGRRFVSSLAPTGGAALRAGDDFVAYLAGAGDSASVTADVVFVGYGITAPEERWDDYAGAEVAGKIVLAIVGTPAGRDSALFQKPARPDYGFRQYKVDEAIRHGAAAAFVIYRQPFPARWTEIAGAWIGEQIQPEDSAPPGGVLRVAGWVNTETAAGLLRAAGQDLDHLADAAARPGFHAIPLSLSLTATARSHSRPLPTVNVLARLPGHGRGGDAVVLGAHYDHLGIGLPIAGDSIYNGALDNASGTAGMLAIAEAFVAVKVRPARSVIFAAFGAEEAGLLGSRAFVRRPPVPLARISAMLNLDGVNLLGDTRDIAALGADLSSLGMPFQAAAAAEGYRITPRDSPIMREAVRQDFFNRSDQAPFARAGVPVLFLYFGDRVGASPPGSGKELLDAYLEQRYHQPSDDLQQRFDYRAAARSLRVFARTLLAVADAAAPAQWKRASPYQRAH